jgi:hypothetical protein
MINWGGLFFLMLTLNFLEMAVFDFSAMKARA